MVGKESGGGNHRSQQAGKDGGIETLELDAKRTRVGDRREAEIRGNGREIVVE